VFQSKVLSLSLLLFEYLIYLSFKQR